MVAVKESEPQARGPELPARRNRFPARAPDARAPRFRPTGNMLRRMRSPRNETSARAGSAAMPAPFVIPDPSHTGAAILEGRIGNFPFFAARNRDRTTANCGKTVAHRDS
ncbi:hypothetical protein GCM10010923_08310 [Blastomonas marina]|uniref:Uncharacterized protein n=1 Tax=Blastomonas marina TaxID=1867408 RepID=A0ABQ1F826_9SPHN|nr:hypothetical protein GCM10010923_08310 [Blastomonas marina]